MARGTGWDGLGCVHPADQSDAGCFCRRLRGGGSGRVGSFCAVGPEFSLDRDLGFVDLPFLCGSMVERDSARTGELGGLGLSLCLADGCFLSGLCTGSTSGSGRPS